MNRGTAKALPSAPTGADPPHRISAMLGFCVLVSDSRLSADHTALVYCMVYLNISCSFVGQPVQAALCESDQRQTWWCHGQVWRHPGPGNSGCRSVSKHSNFGFTPSVTEIEGYVVLYNSCDPCLLVEYEEKKSVFLNYTVIEVNSSKCYVGLWFLCVHVCTLIGSPLHSCKHRKTSLSWPPVHSVSGTDHAKVH